MNKRYSETIGRTTTVQNIIVVGNSNVGKTTVLRQLCKKNTRTENYEGSFVELTYGDLRINNRPYKVVDVPGITSIWADHSEEELIVRELILKDTKNIIVQVTDAKNLKRDLILTCELIELGKPMVLVLNMMDEALDKGIILDEKAIANELGIDVVMTIANEGEGIDNLKRCLIEPRLPNQADPYPSDIETGINQIQDLSLRNGDLNRALAIQFLVGNNRIQDDMGESFFSRGGLDPVNQISTNVNSAYRHMLNSEIIRRRISRALSIESNATRMLHIKKHSLSERMSNYACHPIYGIPILLSVMAVLYLFVGVFGAEFLADFLQFGVIGRYVVPVAEHLLSYIPLAFVQEVFLGPYGLISMGLTAGIGIVFPIICTFFFSYSILEDSGYLSRVGILLNAAFNKLGLNGKAASFCGFQWCHDGVFKRPSTRHTERENHGYFAFVALHSLFCPVEHFCCHSCEYFF